MNFNYILSLCLQFSRVHCCKCVCSAGFWLYSHSNKSFGSNMFTSFPPPAAVLEKRSQRSRDTHSVRVFTWSAFSLKGWLHICLINTFSIVTCISALLNIPQGFFWQFLLNYNFLKLILPLLFFKETKLIWPEFMIFFQSGFKITKKAKNPSV